MRRSCGISTRSSSPTARGDPMSPLRWTCKSTPRLAQELAERGHEVSQRSVCDLLAQLDYRLQSTRKTREGSHHPDRDAQFQHIATMAAQYQAAGDPVISVDTKKKELVGDFKNGGREWQPKGRPEQVRVHDFVDPELGKVAPYGVYDVAANQGWVSVGIDHDTAEFAVESIRRWWKRNGPSALSAGAPPADYSGRRRQQWLAGFACGKSAIAEARRRTGLDDPGLPPPAGHQQVEQDRTSHVLPHHQELARPPPGQPRGRGQSDR